MNSGQSHSRCYTPICRLPRHYAPIRGFHFRGFSNRPAMKQGQVVEFPREFTLTSGRRARTILLMPRLWGLLGVRAHKTHVRA